MPMPVKHVLTAVGIMIAAVSLAILLACTKATEPPQNSARAPAVSQQPQAIPTGAGTMEIGDTKVDGENYIQMGDKIDIKYDAMQITGLSGVADLRCEVVSPDGVVHTSRKPVALEADHAEVSFTYPYEFREGGSPSSTKQPGAYWVHCYVHVAGNGFDGPVAETKGQFRAGKQKVEPLIGPPG